VVPIEPKLLAVQARTRDHPGMGHLRTQQIATSIVALALMCVGTACDKSDDNGNTPRLGNGSALYYCIETADANCDGMSPELEPDPSGISPLPIIGLGSRFDFEMQTRPLTLDRIVADALGGLEAKKEGFAPVSDGSGDYFHVRIAQPDNLVFTHESTEGSNNFDQPVGVDAVGFRVPQDRLRVLVADADGNALAGLYSTTWSTSNEAVVSIVGNAHSSVVTFQINGAGAALLTATVGDLSLDMNFNVTQ
jgi:hypothetical protein